MAYNCITSSYFELEVVAQIKNLIDPLIGVNTQQTEDEWGYAKQLNIRKRHKTTLFLLQNHPNEFTFKIFKG